jgi:hypothetical protein
MSRHFILVISTVLCVACSTTGPSAALVTRERLQALLVQPGDLPAHLTVASYEPSLADGILCDHFPGAVAASVSLVATPGRASGYVTVVVFSNDQTAADAIAGWSSLIHVMGNVVERALTLPNLGTEAYGSYIKVTGPLRIRSPLPPEDVSSPTELRILSYQGRVLVALTLPLVDDSESTLKVALSNALGYGRALFARTRTITH